MPDKELKCDKCTKLWLGSSKDYANNVNFFVDFHIEKATVQGIRDLS